MYHPLPAKTHPISAFTFVRGEGAGVLVSEMSRLGRNYGGRVWNDSADFGFEIRGARKTVLYVLTREECDSYGELLAEYYTACDSRGRTVDGLPVVRLYND